jgi:hypothetical protein
MLSTAGPLPPRRAFRLLGLTTGPDIGLPAASALFGAPYDLSEQALEALVDTHLLESPAPGRYRFHDLIRLYAAERAEEEESHAERDGARRRLRAWQTATLDAARLPQHPGKGSVTLASAS